MLTCTVFSHMWAYKDTAVVLATAELLLRRNQNRVTVLQVRLGPNESEPVPSDDQCCSAISGVKNLSSITDVAE